MNIISDERDITTVSMCEQCHVEKCGREVQSFGYSQESRGWFFLCFDCFGPRIFWRENENSREMYTPISAISKSKKEIRT